VADKDVKKDMLASHDVFIVDSNISIFVWIGKNATKAEKSVSMKTADDYLKHSGKPDYTPITAMNEGQINIAFDSCFKR
jgi:hypothetical protein